MATSSGRCSDLQAGDGGAGDVDVVGRAERLAQHVVDAGLLEDDRAAPPAMTPVPGAAGFSRTRPAPVLADDGWVIVMPASGTSKRLRLASSVPFWMASGTSLALP